MKVIKEKATVVLCPLVGDYPFLSILNQDMSS